MMASGAGSAVTGASTQIVVFQGATTSTSLAIAVPGLNAAEDEATAKAIEAKMRSENTKKNYKSGRNAFTKWAKSNDLALTVTEEYFGNMEAVPDIAAIKLRGETQTLRLFLASRCKDKNGRLLTKSTPSNARNAMVAWWKYKEALFLPQTVTMLSEFLESVGKNVASARETGALPAKEGKRELTFAAYIILAGLFLARAG